MSIKSQLVLHDRIVVSGRISFDSYICDITPLLRTTERYILPGFIEGHAHGGVGAYTMDGLTESIATGDAPVVTIAPELKHSPTAMQTFFCGGIRISLGHTITEHAGTERAICLIYAADGRVEATHIFNAMVPIEGHRPDPIPALIYTDGAYGEMIFDTHHVHPASFRLAERVLGRPTTSHDGLRARHRRTEPDGPSPLGRQACSC